MSIQNKSHILVVTQYFYPEQFRINDICKEWVKRGYKVTVLTGIPNYPAGKFYPGYDLKHRRRECWNGIDIIRIPLIPRGNNAIGLASNYLSFVISGFFWKLFTKIDADIVFNYEVSPMTQVYVGTWYAKKRRIPNYLYLTDLWPDNVEIVTGIHNKLFINTIDSMCNHLYKNCDKIFTCSKSFVKILTERKVPGEKLEFWPQYSEDCYHPVSREDNILGEIPQDGRFNIVFAGNIGYAQGLGMLVDTACLLKKKNCAVRFNFVGDGRYKEEFIMKIQQNDVDEYFNFIAKQPAERVPVYMAWSDATLICLSKSDAFSMTLPAKTQSCTACGIPILVAADGEIQDVVNEANCGFCSAAADPIGLAENIQKMMALSPEERKIMGENALQYSVMNFNKEKLLNAMDKYLNSNKIKI